MYIRANLKLEISSTMTVSK